MTNKPITYLLTLDSSHIGKRYVEDSDGKLIHVADAIGPVQAIDIGKRVYLNGDVIQVENNEQRDARIREGE